jgi:hypothetical protein
MARRLSLWALALLVAACGGGGGGPTVPAPTTATLTGTVHIQGGTTAVAGAAVSAQGASTTTDARGDFALTNLAPGQTTVSLTRDGYRATAIGVTLVVGNNHFSIAMEPVDCPELGGNWQASWGNACGVAGAGMLTVQQVGCDLSVSSPIAAISGPMSENIGAIRFRVELPSSCAGGPTIGGLQLQADSSWWLPFGDGTDCCRHGSITLRR